MISHHKSEPLRRGSASRLKLQLVRNVLQCLALLTLTVENGWGQTDNMAPMGIAPGAPAGSYALSDLESINLFNGNLSFHLPLLQVGGRGEARHTIALAITEQRWGTKVVENGTVVPRFNWRPRRAGYGPGVLHFHRTSPPPGQTVRHRFTFTAPDETQFELRDAIQDNEPGFGTTVRRVFRTFDGTAVTYVSDAQVPTSGTVTVTGMLLFPDGRQYRIVDGLVEWIRDRNGNAVQFSYEDPPAYQNPPWGRQVKQITDSLRRSITFTYASAASPQDVISFKGFGNTSRQITINYTALAASLLTGEAIKTLGELFPEVSWTTPGTVHNPTVVASVVLPNSRSYSFKYSSYGELVRAVLPTGGILAYSYGAGLASSPPSGTIGLGPRIYRRLRQRSAYSGPEVARTLYEVEQHTEANDQYIEVAQVDPASGTTLARSRHFFHGRSSDLLPETSENPPWRNGLEYKTESYSGAATPVKLKTVEHNWQQRETPPWWTGLADDAPPNDPRITQTVTTLWETDPDPARISYTAFQHDRYNNVTSAEEYDFSNGAAYPLLRRTTTAYVTAVNGTEYAASSTVHLRRLPNLQRITTGPAGQQIVRAETVYEYDAYPATAPLVSRSSPSGRLSPESHPVTYTTRGNATAVRRWLNTGNRYLSTTRQYDMLGNVVLETDPRLFATAMGYTDAFGSPDSEARSNTPPGALGAFQSYGFVTSTSNPKGHTTFSQYDFWTGRMVNFEDANGVISSASYADPLARPTSVVRAVAPAAAATWAKQETQFIYYDEGPSVDIKVDKDTFQDRASRRLMVYDGLGREIEARSHEPDGNTISVYRGYDAMGRPRTVSNPTRSGTAVQNTTTNYDALGRVSAVIAPGSAATTSATVANEVTVTDPQGRPRLFRRDAAGRLVFVEEDPGPSGQGYLNYPTSYEYDALDNLVTVTQGAQVRRFEYDSLSRLTKATNPEAIGDTTYTYDDAGNLATRTDPRGKVTTYVHDELNRLTSRSYSDATPAVSLRYDDLSDDGITVLYAKGRLTRVASAPSTTRITGYDSAGRAWQSRQQTAGATYQLSYAYDLLGNLRAETYPSGRTVETTYDSVSRIQQVKEPTIVYAGNVSYAAHGLTTALQLGNARWESATYNNRLQAKIIGLGQSSTVRDLFAVENFYGTNANPIDVPSSNNGNVTRQTLVAPGLNLTTTYSYDRLNRLLTAAETNPGAVWSQTFAYDQYGNRAQTAGLAPTPAETPSNLALHYEATRNRLTTAFSGQILYDNAGNLTRDAIGRTLTYDAENRLTGVGTSTYAYDGDGRRVREVVSSAGTTYVYDIFGKLVAEYAAGATPSPPTAVYVTQDHLGSARVATDSVGGVAARFDYFSFGQQIATALGGRSGVAGYGSDPGVRVRFSGKERDGGSGLDYFGARYLAGAQGRFTSPDPLNVAIERGDQRELAEYLADPQHWNKYTYALNSPFKYVDPDGAHAVLIQRIITSPAAQRAINYVSTQGRVVVAWAQNVAARFLASPIAQNIVRDIAEDIAGAAPGSMSLPTARTGLVRQLHLRELGLDPAMGEKGYRAVEATLAGALESSGVRLSRALDVGDWVDRAGRVYDAVGSVDAKHFVLEGVTSAIRRHLGTPGVDLVVVDARGYNAHQFAAVGQFLGKLSPEDQARIIVVR
jgi:RHS repeat-associated protein